VYSVLGVCCWEWERGGRWVGDGDVDMGEIESFYEAGNMSLIR